VTPSTQQLPRPIQFWHPLKKEWREGQLVKLGRKWAYVTYVTGKARRLSLSAIREVANVA
jgi:hypothetical protein